MHRCRKVPHQYIAKGCPGSQLLKRAQLFELPRSDAAMTHASSRSWARVTETTRLPAARRAHPKRTRLRRIEQHRIRCLPIDMRVGPEFTRASHDPDLSLSTSSGSCHRAKAATSVERGAPPRRTGWPKSTAMTHPLRSSPITGPSSLLRGSPPLSGASVLSASRLEPLAPFPLASPARFSRSVPEPDELALPTRRMPLGRYQDILRAGPGDGSARFSHRLNRFTTLQKQFACARLSRSYLPGSMSRLFRDAHDRGF